MQTQAQAIRIPRWYRQVVSIDWLELPTTNNRGMFKIEKKELKKRSICSSKNYLAHFTGIGKKETSNKKYNNTYLRRSDCLPAGLTGMPKILWKNVQQTWAKSRLIIWNNAVTLQISSKKLCGFAYILHTHLHIYMYMFLVELKDFA